MRRWLRKRESWLLAIAGFTVFAAHGQQLQPGFQNPTANDEHIQSPQSADPGLAESQALIEKGRYPEAELQVRTYLEGHPESADAHFLLGYALYREDKPRESLAEYTSGARFRKPGPNDLAVVAMDYILLRDYSDADKWLTQAASRSPDNELYCYYLGRTKYVENHFDEAVDVFRKCLTLSPHDLRAEYNLGLAYAGGGHTDQATAAYQTAIDWQKSTGVRDPQPYLDFGSMLLEQGKPDQALPLLQQAVALGPENPRAHEQLGQAWKQLNNLLNADAELQAAVHLAPDISALHFELGRIFQSEGQAAKAKQEFERCAALNAAHSTDSAATPNLPPRN